MRRPHLLAEDRLNEVVTDLPFIPLGLSPLPAMIGSMVRSSIITFSSDFGTREYYVGAVKGAILSVSPEAQIIDASHSIPSHDILGAAFTLAGYASDYPLKTVHLMIVDPGVGSDRRCLAVETEKQYYVAPDNGVLSLIYARERVIRAVSIEANHYIRRTVSPTFHGRDIFGPAAAWLTRGINIENLGPAVSDYKRLTLPMTKELSEQELEGFVLHVDKFGNIITSFEEAEIEKRGGIGASSRMVVNGKVISSFVKTYSDGNSSEPFALVGSCGYYEIALALRQASHVLDVKRGMKVRLTL